MILLNIKTGHSVKTALFVVSLFISSSLWAQVKIGDNPSSINANSLLELESSDKGVLIPRIALSSSSSASPLSAHVSGMVVYNTATSGSGTTAVSPGFYYNDGSQWVKVANNNAQSSENNYDIYNCSCTGSFPYTLPADLTSFHQYNGGWSGNGQNNTTAADFILPSWSNARASGRKIGDIVVIHRSSSYNVVMGTTNTDLSSNLLIPINTSVGFSLGMDKWYRVF